MSKPILIVHTETVEQAHSLLGIAMRGWDAQGDVRETGGNSAKLTLLFDFHGQRDNCEELFTAIPHQISNCWAAILTWCMVSEYEVLMWGRDLNPEPPTSDMDDSTEFKVIGHIGPDNEGYKQPGERNND